LYFRDNKSGIPGLNKLCRIFKKKNAEVEPAWEGDFYLGGNHHVGRISRDQDGRFVLVDSAESTMSSSDDGGFLSRPGFRNIASWRRPLVGYPSDLSLNSTVGTAPSPTRQPNIPVIYSPKSTQFISSSPASSILPPVTPVLSPPYFSDLSSVRKSAEQTLRSVHEQYSQELPSLHAIQEQQRRRRYVPRHVRSAPDLFTETSPESRSSSSGFGSKNTSSQQNSSATVEWRYPGAYRAPALPPPPPIWLQYTSAIPSPTQSELSHRPSVDDQYEFDVYPVSPTPPEISPELKIKYDNIEARVQAMKEEFHAFRARQARRMRTGLESAC
jgi:hypothetical protein